MAVRAWTWTSSPFSTYFRPTSRASAAPANEPASVHSVVPGRRVQTTYRVASPRDETDAAGAAGALAHRAGRVSRVSRASRASRARVQGRITALLLQVGRDEGRVTSLRGERTR